MHRRTETGDPEFELLVGCARLALSPEQEARIGELLSMTLDWDRLYALADKHSLRPMLFRHLGDGRLGPIPEQFESRLWRHSEQLRARNRVMENELVELLALLRTAGIPALAHKGPIVARRVYGDFALREYGDLDLLMARGDISRAKEVLESRGYLPKFPMTPVVEAKMLASPAQYHLMLAHRDHGLLVELHWQTDNDYAVERMRGIDWSSQAPTIEIMDLPVACLPAPEFFLALCLHGSKHYWESLHWLVDVGELMRGLGEDAWTRLLEWSRRLRAERRFGLALLLADRTLDVGLPGPVLAWASRLARVPELAAAVEGGWPGLDFPARSARARLALDLALCDGTDQRLRHLGRTVLVPGVREWSLWPLPRSLHFLYVPIRLGRVLKRSLG